MRRALTAGLLLVALAALGYAGFSALKHNAPPLDDFGPAGDFSLTERDGSTITNADLAGKVWIASFVFTRCTGPCPQVTGTMARLQSELKGEPDVRFVTFTVDPKRDRPDELKRYADHFRADAERWLFLTGDEETIHRLLTKGFMVAAGRSEQPNPPFGQEFDHSTLLVVVDKQGNIRGYYPGYRSPDGGASEQGFEDALRQLREKVVELAK